MMESSQAKQQLIELLKQHDVIQAYQKAEAKIKHQPDLEHLVYDMKSYQQDSVLFQKIDKKNAKQVSEQKVDTIQSELDNLPIVQDYREKMQDASDLLQYITKTLEEKINEELADGKR